MPPKKQQNVSKLGKARRKVQLPSPQEAAAAAEATTGAHAMMSDDDDAADDDGASSDSGGTRSSKDEDEAITRTNPMTEAARRSCPGSIASTRQGSFSEGMPCATMLFHAIFCALEAMTVSRLLNEIYVILVFFLKKNVILVG